MSEGSVTRAATRLPRPPWAISHSLARLREQLSDPLPVKTGNGMMPGPFAENLIAQVRPILRSIRRIVAPPVAFDPSTNTRLFRAVIADFAPTPLPWVLSEVHRQALGVKVAWLAPSVATIAAVADAQVDLSMVESGTQITDGVRRADADELTVTTFARKDHPGMASGGSRPGSDGRIWWCRWVSACAAKSKLPRRARVSKGPSVRQCRTSRRSQRSCPARTCWPR